MSNMHINDEHLVKKAKKTEGSAYAQNLEVFPKYNKATEKFKLCGKISHTAIQVTPMTKPYIEENVSMQTSINTWKICKKGTHDILLVSAGMAASSDSEEVRNALSAYLRGYFYLVKVEVEGKILYDVAMKVYDHYESMTRMKPKKIEVVGRDGVSRPATDNVRVTIPTYLVEEPAGSKNYGSIRKDVVRFGGEAGCVINSSSQGRKTQMAMYKNNTRADIEKFYSVLNYATNDEYALRLGELVNGKGLADANTRISSKSTAVALNKEDGCTVDTFVFLFSADDNLDGSADLSAYCLARNFCHKYEIPQEDVMYYANLFKGYLVQCRPQTSKVAAYVATEDAMKKRLEGLKIYTYDAQKKDLVVEREILMMLHKNKRNKKHLRALKGYDGVRICFNGTDKPDDYIGDTNAVKDVFAIRNKKTKELQNDGINILNIAHFDENDSEGWFKAHTCAQFLKTVIRSVKMNNAGDENIRSRFHNVMVNIMKDTFDRDVADKAQVRRPHFGKIEDNYVSGFAREINPHGLEKYPSMLKASIQDRKSRMLNRVMFDRYDCPGHAAMITADLIYRYFGMRILEIKDNYFEVFDPVADRYRKTFDIKDQRGLMEKNPAMGTLETGKLFFVTEEELIARANKLIGDNPKFTEDDLHLAVEIIRTFKEGGLWIPAHLEAIARIEAGLDEDGDKGVVHFARKDDGLVEVVWDSGFIPRSVDINPAGTMNDQTTYYGPTAFREQMTRMIEINNHGVGVITNQFRIIVEGLLLDEDDEEGKDWFINFFMGVFKMGVEANKAENPYVSQFQEENDTLTKDEFGFFVYHTKGSIVDDVQAAIRRADPTWENVLKALDDLDIVGRHCQELTIDAQKKFYAVEIAFMDEMSNAGYNILPLCCGIDLDMHWQNSEADITIINKVSGGVRALMPEEDVMNGVPAIEYVRDKENQFVYVEVNDAISNFIRNDAFGEYRCIALEMVIEALEELRTKYFRLVNDPVEKQKRTDAYVLASDYIKNKGISVRIDAAINTAKHCDHIYHEYVASMRSIHICKGMKDRDIEEVERLIRSAAKQEYSEMMADIDNEIRAVASDVPIDILIDYINGGAEVSGGFLGKLLVPETMYYLAKHAERPYAYEECRVNGADISFVEYALDTFVKDRHLFADGVEIKTIVPDAVEDGPVDIVCEDDKLYYVRPLTDFIEIPTADKSRFVLNVQLKNCLSKDENGKWGTWTEYDKMNQAENYETIKKFNELKADQDIYVKKVPVPNKYHIYDFAIFANGERLGAIHIPRGTFRFFEDMYSNLHGKMNSIWNTSDGASMFISLKDCIFEQGEVEEEVEAPKITIVDDSELDFLF